MLRCIKEFYKNGQLHLLAFVDEKKILSIRVFDADGSEFKWVNQKLWKLDSFGDLISPKQSMKYNFEEENGPMEDY